MLSAFPTNYCHFRRSNPAHLNPAPAVCRSPTARYNFRLHLLFFLRPKQCFLVFVLPFPSRQIAKLARLQLLSFNNLPAILGNCQPSRQRGHLLLLVPTRMRPKQSMTPPLSALIFWFSISPNGKPSIDFRFEILD